MGLSGTWAKHLSYTYHGNIFGIHPSTPTLAAYLDNCNVTGIIHPKSRLEMASWSRDEKEIFFARLDGLDELALESEDNITSDSLGHPQVSIILHRACRTSDQKAPSSQVELTCPPEVTRLGQFAPSSQKVMPTQSSNRRSRSGRPTPKLSRRQSSKKSLQLQTEDAQIFRGLTFCEATPAEPPLLGHTD